MSLSWRNLTLRDSLYRHKTVCLFGVRSYASCMPRLWSQTIEDHRQDVREAILDATETLWQERGPLSLTMSQIATEAGIGRATLYKYFTDVQSIAQAWHQRNISRHLAVLNESRLDGRDPWERLERTLSTYTDISRARHRHAPTDLARLLHQREHVARAEHHLHNLFRELIAEAVEAGAARRDVTPDELAHYCLHAASAAQSLPSAAAVRRLVAVILAGVRAND